MQPDAGSEPQAQYTFASAKVQQKIDICKFFEEKVIKFLIFIQKSN